MGPKLPLDSPIIARLPIQERHSLHLVLKHRRSRQPRRQRPAQLRPNERTRRIACRLAVVPDVQLLQHRKVRIAQHLVNAEPVVVRHQRHLAADACAHGVDHAANAVDFFHAAAVFNRDLQPASRELFSLRKSITANLSIWFATQWSACSHAAPSSRSRWCSLRLDNQVARSQISIENQQP